jgi:dinuclear metal center YbgI/SA1388 family protein
VTVGAWNVGDCVRVLERAYAPGWAADWDAVGLTVGAPDAPVTRVHVAVDPTLEVAQEAVAAGAQLLVTHHPLLLRGVHEVAETSASGRVVAALVRGGCALFTAHTNADVARPGVSDALADAIGLQAAGRLAVDPLPEHQQPGEDLDKLAVFVPLADRVRLLEVLAAAGAGAIGDYDRCGFWTAGTGTFRPLPGANPFVGQVGQPETVAEERLEMIAPEAFWLAVVAAMKAAHPYEVVAYDVYPLKNAAAEYGIGRVGALPEPMATDAFLAHVKEALDYPEVRIAGPRDREVRAVAVCGGAGAGLMPDALSAGADALVTADVRHHEFVDAEARGFLLLDAGHAATETPGARELASRLAALLPAVGFDFV